MAFFLGINGKMPKKDAFKKKGRIVFVTFLMSTFLLCLLWDYLSLHAEWLAYLNKPLSS